MADKAILYIKRAQRYIDLEKLPIRDMPVSVFDIDEIRQRKEHNLEMAIKVFKGVLCSEHEREGGQVEKEWEGEGEEQGGKHQDRPEGKYQSNCEVKKPAKEQEGEQTSPIEGCGGECFKGKEGCVKHWGEWRDGWGVGQHKEGWVKGGKGRHAPPHARVETGEDFDEVVHPYCGPSRHRKKPVCMLHGWD
ncbi:hypothetical protein K470DRAFT_270572 [Piedraia hortae CBS 480.64]|uniref:Uncharacterized protein n=1 Tax=Piedraia hortae CBS 480.64 TaxID=1314780 RepID=A0A6A7C0I6_9PEZI|nr:hypothetical protein K470DRAFT_270572 [Piedraia hortae CBS 480.64]